MRWGGDGREVISQNCGTHPTVLRHLLDEPRNDPKTRTSDIGNHGHPNPHPTPPPRRPPLPSPLACLTWVSALGGMRASRRKPMATNLFRRTIILPFSVVLGGMQGFDSLPPMDLSEILDEASEPPPPRTCSHPTRIAIGTCDALWFATGGPSTPTACPQPLRLPPYHGVSFGTPARHLLFFGPPFPRYEGRGLPFLPAEAPAPPPPPLPVPRRLILVGYLAGAQVPPFPPPGSVGGRELR